MRKLMLAVLLVLLSWLTMPALAEVTTREVEYQCDGTKLVGLLALDETVSVIRPAVLVVHEWWGRNDYAATRAKMLAKLGYIAFAVDMYGDGKTTTDPKQAGAWAGQIYGDFAGVGLKRFNAALDTVKKMPQVDGSRVAAIGYCFGGGVVLNAARAGVDLRAVVSFHGSLKSLVTPKEGGIKASVLVCKGAEDNFDSPEVIAAFKEQMKQVKADWQFIDYAHAMHGFTNPSAGKAGIKGVGYDEKADHRSWEAMRSLLLETLRE